MAGGIDLWHIDLDQWPAAEGVLSARERERRDRFHFSADRSRYASAHAATREILAGYAGCAPADLTFIVSPAGKPALDPAIHSPAPAFNLSHSGRWAALAVAAGGAIGVDVECARREPSAAFMRQMLSPNERREAEKLDADQLGEVFLVAWTRKEACLKALGVGFAIAAHEIEVGLSRGARTIAVATLPAAAAAATGAAWISVLTLPQAGGATVSVAQAGAPMGVVTEFPAKFPEEPVAAKQ